MPPVSESDDLEALEDHPAVYSPAVLEAIDDVLERHGHPLSPRGGLRILDPYAGKGSGVDRWGEAGYDAVGVELEPEWKLCSQRVIRGDATHLDSMVDELGGLFDALVTSPCYGNRMADCHEAKDRCPACVPPVGHNPSLDASGGPCKKCKGTGFTPRITYRHKLGRMPSTGSAAILQWGGLYRDHHKRFLEAALEVLEPGALCVVNMKNHIRDGVEQLVTEWWVNTLLVRGCQLVEVRRVPTPGMGYGANGSARTECEFLIVVRMPAIRTLL